MMWTVKRRRPRPALSDWELAERRERMRHAAALVGRGATVAAVAEDMGVSYETVRGWVRRAGEGTRA